MFNAVVPKSAKPFNFQKAYKLTDEQALDVSDHYPVEVTLKSKVPEEEEVELDEVQLLQALPPSSSSSSKSSGRR